MRNYQSLWKKICILGIFSALAGKAGDLCAGEHTEVHPSSGDSRMKLPAAFLNATHNRSYLERGIKLIVDNPDDAPWMHDELVKGNSITIPSSAHAELWWRESEPPTAKAIVASDQDSPFITFDDLENNFTTLIGNLGFISKNPDRAIPSDSSPEKLLGAFGIDYPQGIALAYIVPWTSLLLDLPVGRVHHLHQGVLQFALDPANTTFVKERIQTQKEKIRRFQQTLAFEPASATSEGRALVTSTGHVYNVVLREGRPGLLYRGMLDSIVGSSGSLGRSMQGSQKALIAGTEWGFLYQLNPVDVVDSALAKELTRLVKFTPIGKGGSSPLDGTTLYCLEAFSKPVSIKFTE